MSSHCSIFYSQLNRQKNCYFILFYFSSLLVHLIFFIYFVFITRLQTSRPLKWWFITINNHPSFLLVCQGKVECVSFHLIHIFLHFFGSFMAKQKCTIMHLHSMWGCCIVLRCILKSRCILLARVEWWHFGWIGKLGKLEWWFGKKWRTIGFRAQTLWVERARR